MNHELPKQTPTERYELLRLLGEGGFGAVYAALDRETGEHVAVKKLSRMTPLSVLRFKREFRALADIRHRNLVKLYELENAESGWFLTTELVEGRSLSTLWETSSANDNGPSIEKLIDVFGQLAQGVRAIHLAGMLHRDLKPTNVMLEPTGRVVVLDFGLVRELGTPMQDLTLQGTTSGTPGYMAPEQANADELTEASDWYAFGVMLYEALTGSLPIEGRTPFDLLRRKLTIDAPSLPSDVGTPPMRDLCERLLRRDPRQRPDAQEILAVLPQRVEVGPQNEQHTTDFSQYSSFTLDTQSQSGGELFGRDAERQQLESALSACIRGQSAVVAHVRGASGSGKTALVEGFLTESVDLGIGGATESLVLRGRCYEREAMPFKSIDGVVDALVTHLLTLDDVQVAHIMPQHVGALTELFPAFERLPSLQQLLSVKGRRSQADHVQLRRRAEEGLRYVLRGIALSRPLIVWIDDLQWGDLDSTLLLKDWLNTPIDAPILIILSYRGEETATTPCLSELVSAKARSTQLTQQFDVELQPLRDTDIYSLCWKRIGPTNASSQVISQIVKSAQGNPFLATELAALAHVRLASGETELTSLTVDQLVSHATSMVSEASRELLQVLSVAGRPLSLRLALAASRIVRARRAHLHELQTLRLVRTRNVAGEALLEVYHDSVRRSVEAGLQEADRKRINSTLLNILAREQNVDVAWLHELALAAGESDMALRFGLLAADNASKSLAFERAVELYTRCVQLSGSNADLAQLLPKLANAYVRCRRGSQAADTYLKACEFAQGADRVDLMQLAASHLLRSGRFKEGEHWVRQLLAALQIRVPDSEAGLYAAIGWERARIALLERTVRPRADAVFPPDAQRLGTLYAMLALDAQCYNPLRATLFQMRATRICFQYGESQATARAYCMNAALSTLSADTTAAKRVDELLDHAEALIDHRNHPEITLELHSSRAICAMLLGRLAQVIEPANAAEDLYMGNSAGGEFGDYYYMFFVRSARISALQFLGRHIEAAHHLTQLLEDAYATDNRCAVLQATYVRTGVEQADSSCRDSRARLEAERRELPETTSVLHMLHVMSVLRVAAMTGEYDWGLEVYGQFRARLEASPLKRSTFLNYLLRVSHARLVLNHHVTAGNAGPAPLGQTQLDWLEKKAPITFRKAAPLRLRARLAMLRGDSRNASELLEASGAAHAELGSIDEAARERYALGLLIGGADGQQLIDAAFSALRTMGVRDPEREMRGYYPELLRSA